MPYLFAFLAKLAASVGAEPMTLSVSPALAILFAGLIAFLWASK